MRMLPPPAAPLASISAPASVISRPVMVMSPPRSGRRAGRADSSTWMTGREVVRTLPVTRTLPPPPPPSMTCPLRPLTVRASTTPLRLMACRAALRAVAAEICTVPPLA